LEIGFIRIGYVYGKVGCKDYVLSEGARERMAVIIKRIGEYRVSIKDVEMYQKIENL